MKIRMMPIGGAKTASVGGPGLPNADRRVYQAQPGQTIDVFDTEESVVASQGFTTICAVGATADRPNNRYLKPGFQYLDTDLALIIAWDGAVFRNPVTGAVV